MRSALLIGSLVAALAAPHFTESSTDVPAEKWIRLGVVGVDSGQLLVLDPAYIDSEWVPEGKGENWTLKYWGRDKAKLVAEFGASPIACKTAQDAAELDKRIQKHCTDRDLAVVTWVQSGSSYEKCSAMTAGKDGFGQLKYTSGRPGLGVALVSGYGDGIYPVYGRENDKGVMVELRVFFDEDDPDAKAIRKRAAK